MGGYPSSPADGRELFASLTPGIQRFSLTGSGLPLTPDQPRKGLQEDRLKLLLDAFPGLAGSLHIAPLDGGGLARRFAGWRRRGISVRPAPAWKRSLFSPCDRVGRSPMCFVTPTNRRPNWLQRPPTIGKRLVTITLQRSGMRPATRGRRPRLTTKITLTTSPES